MEEILTLTEQIEALIEEKRFSAIRELLQEYFAADIAELFENLDKQHFLLAYRLLPKETAAEVFVEMAPEWQAMLIDAFSDYELRQILNELYLDDTVDLVEEMPANVVSRILRNSSAEQRKTINQILQYPDDCAGSIMTTEYVNLKQEMTVEEALRVIRQVAIDSETIYTCYVTSPGRKLVGIVSAKSLMISPLPTKVEDIMKQNFISVSTHTDKEEVGFMFGKYGLLALPVVDTENRIVGIITVDDAIEVIQEEAEEDFTKMAAITPSETPYLRASSFSIWKARIPWLIILTLSATFTGMIISAYEASLSACVALTAFIPMLMGTGGNSGSQASTTVIRGLSVGEIRFSDILLVLWKEIRVSLLCAVSLAVVTYAKIFLIDYLLLHSLESGEMLTVPIVVCLTMALTVICAKLIGCLLPILAKKIGFDPAVMAAPFITTIVDALTLVVYFAIACAIIPGLQ